MKHHTAAVLAVAAATVAATADVTAVGEFAGEAYETFENIAGPGGYPGPLGIFEGQATVNDSVANTVVIAFNWNGPAGEVLPFDGNLMGGIPAGTAVFDFSTAVTRFGGWFNTVGLVGGGTAVFKDEQGAIVDTLAFAGAAAEWTWAGWESTVGISRIELTGNNGVGFGFQFDNLTLNYVPAPASLGVLGCGVLAGVRRRR